MTKEFQGVFRQRLPTQTNKYTVHLVTATGNNPDAEFYEEGLPIEGTHYEIEVFNAEYAGKYTFLFASQLREFIEKVKQVNSNFTKEDIKINVWSSTKKSNWINETNTGIQIIHLATGIVVECETERSQHKNKQKAIHMLTTKLKEYNDGNNNA